MTVQGPAKKRQPDGMSHRGGGGVVYLKPPPHLSGPLKEFDFPPEDKFSHRVGGGGAAQEGQNSPAPPPPNITKQSSVAASVSAPVARPRAKQKNANR